MRPMSIQDRQYRFATEHKVYCKNPKCSGHGVVFRNVKQERKLCPNCNCWVYKDDKTKLKYEMLERGIKIDS